MLHASQVQWSATCIRLRGGGDAGDVSDNDSNDSTEIDEELHHALVCVCCIREPHDPDGVPVLVGYVLFPCEDTEPDEHVYYFRLLSVHGGILNRVRLDPRAEVPCEYPFPQGGPYYMSFSLQWQRMRRLTWPHENDLLCDRCGSNYIGSACVHCGF